MGYMSIAGRGRLALAAMADVPATGQPSMHLLDEVLDGVACFQVEWGDDGEPVDAQMVHISDRLAALAGAHRAGIVGTWLSEFGGYVDPEFHECMETIVRRALSRRPAKLEFFSERLARHYSVVAQVDGDAGLLVVFHDITDLKRTAEVTRHLSQVALECVELPFGHVDFGAMADHVLRLSGAKIAIVNTYHDDNSRVVTRAVSGVRNSVRRAAGVLGIELVGKEWVLDDDSVVRDLSSHRLSRLSGIHEASLGQIPEGVCAVLERVLDIGSVWAVGISSHGEILGGILLLMPGRAEDPDRSSIELLAAQLGMLLLSKRAEEELSYLSSHDRLTGLHNRSWFEEQLARIDTLETPMSVIIADVNGLKLVNDTFGHSAGDDLLVTVAGILKGACRPGDIVSRWGGDEFIVLLPLTDRREVGEVCARIRTACLHAGNTAVPLSVSLGSATMSDPSAGIETAIKEAEERMYRHKLLQQRSIRSSIIASLQSSLAEKTNETEAHASRLRHHAHAIGTVLGLPQTELDDLTLLAALHDIGKIGVPDRILQKEGNLTPGEWAVIRRHCEIGYRIATSSPDLAPIAEGILSHHEKWDGSGYPRGLRGTEIPLGARIIAVADAFDAMISGRPYRAPMSLEDAVAEIRRCSGTQFDPEVVDAFIASGPQHAPSLHTGNSNAAGD